jgi:hypothetical protein
MAASLVQVQFVGGLVVLGLLGVVMAALVWDTFRPFMRDATRRAGVNAEQEVRDFRQARQALLFLVGFALLLVMGLWIGSNLRS